MSDSNAMTQRRVEHIVRSLSVLEAAIQETRLDRTSCEAQPTVVDLVGWSKELLAEMLALRAENTRLQKELSRSKLCGLCSGTGGRFVVLLNLGQCKACEGTGRQ